MQWRKLLLGFSFYSLMVASVLAIWLFASTVDLNTASSIHKGKAYGFFRIVDLQLLTVVVYALGGLFLSISLKRKSPHLSKVWFAACYVLHFAVFIMPSLVYLITMLCFALDPSFNADNA